MESDWLAFQTLTAPYRTGHSWTVFQLPRSAFYLPSRAEVPRALEEVLETTNLVSHTFAYRRFHTQCSVKGDFCTVFDSASAALSLDLLILIKDSLSLFEEQSFCTLWQTIYQVLRSGFKLILS